MAMKTILVPIPDTEINLAAIETGMMVARAVEGHLNGLYIEPPLPLTTGATPLTAYDAPSYGRAAPTTVQRAEADRASAEEERNRTAERARAEFERACAAYQVPVHAAPPPGPMPSASWHRTQGSYATAVSRRAPGCDLLVVPNPATAAMARDIAEQILLETGRPVLLSPAGPAQDPSRSAMIAWSPTLQAWRAVAAAVPLLAQAERVEILSVGRDDEEIAESRADVIAYLGWHGIAASARHMQPQSRGIGDTLLNEAGEADVGMLVMGAYSHGRVRQLLLGGLTRYVLTHIGTTPVFMAH
jgi:nucleotide-binding universal stress UspA family protein